MVFYGRRKNFSWRSGFEKLVADQLKAKGIEFQYESEQIEYKDRVSSGECSKCGDSEVFQRRKYKPDFTLPNGIRIEAKGFLDQSDRRKLELVRAQHPKLDLRIVFQKNNLTGMKGNKTYSQWAINNGFKYCIKEIPDDWFK